MSHFLVSVTKRILQVHRPVIEFKRQHLLDLILELVAKQKHHHCLTK